MVVGQRVGRVDELVPDWALVMSLAVIMPGSHTQVYGSLLRMSLEGPDDANQNSGTTACTLSATQRKKWVAVRFLRKVFQPQFLPHCPICFQSFPVSFPVLIWLHIGLDETPWLNPEADGKFLSQNKQKTLVCLPMNDAS